MSDKLAIVDRDGTIIIEPERPEGIDPRETFPLKSEDEVIFMDGAIEGLKFLKSKGYELALATNQTFLGTNKHPREIFDRTMDYLVSKLAENDIKFDYVMVCPHGPDEGCDCRKPQPEGMKRLIEAANFDLENSYMFGDRATDGEFAENLGVNFVKIETNKKFRIPDEITDTK